MPRKSTTRAGSSTRERTASPAHVSHSELESLNLKELHELHKSMHPTAGPAKKSDLVEAILKLQKDREIEEEDRDELDTISERQSATPRKKRKRTSTTSPVVEIPVIPTPPRRSVAARRDSISEDAGEASLATPAKRGRGRPPKAHKTGLNLNSAPPANISAEEEDKDDSESDIQILEDHRQARTQSANTEDSGVTQTPAKKARLRSKTPTQADVQPPASAARKGKTKESALPHSTGQPVSSPSRTSGPAAEKTRAEERPRPSLTKHEVETLINQALETREKELSELHKQTTARIEAELKELYSNEEKSRKGVQRRLDALEKTTTDSSERDALEERLRKEMADLAAETKKKSDELLSALDRLITSKASSDEVKAIRNSINTQIQTNVGLQSEQNGLRSHVEALTREFRSAIPQQELLKMLDDISAVQQREHAEARRMIDQGVTNFNLLKANLGQTNQQIAGLRTAVESSASQAQLSDATGRLTRLASEQGRIAAKVDLLEADAKDKATLADLAKLQGALEKQSRDADAAVGAVENRLLAVQDASSSGVKQEMRKEIENLREEMASHKSGQAAQEQRLQAIRPDLEALFAERIRQAIDGEASASDIRHQAALQAELRRLTEQRDKQLATQLEATREEMVASTSATIDTRLKDQRAEFDKDGARMVGDVEQRLRRAFAADLQSARADLRVEISDSRSAIEEAARKSEAATAELKATAHIHILNSSDLKDRLKLLVRNEVAPIERKVQQTSGLAEYTAEMVNDFEKMVDERVALRLAEQQAGGGSSASESNSSDVKALERMVAQLSADLRETKLELRNLKRQRQADDIDERDDEFEAEDEEEEEEEEEPARVSPAPKPKRISLAAEETVSFSPMQAFKWAVGLDAKQPSTPTLRSTNGHDTRLTRSTVKKQRRI